ncbi:MAG: hypothetical protein KDB84_02480 [Flavobacteriales bacterium]|nr:hypothetical protein [Flavobacteriales bacterium]
MNRFLLSLFASMGILISAAQVLVSDSLLTSFTVQELLDAGVGGAEYPVEVHRLVYNTVDAHGAPTLASGAIVVPVQNACYHALAAYMHGTILNREDVPSRLSGEIIVGYFLGSAGYVAVLPDYLGLGDGPGRHPYVHARSEATACVDMLRAAREYCDQHGTLLNGQLFLAGYSQGGHACMATHKYIQEEVGGEFTVTASAPCSGPYDVSGVQAEVMVSPDPYPAPYYLPYVIFSYGYVYPDLYSDISEVFKEPWATTLPPLFQGNNGSGAVDAVMPDVPSTILQDSVLQNFSTMPDHRMRVALRENDLYDWAPLAPVKMIYCQGDNHVFYRNSIVALDAMQANGAQQVSTMDLGGLDHGDCAYPALLQAKAMFDAMQGDCTWNGIDDLAVMDWSVYPNPASGSVRLSMRSTDDGRFSWELFQNDGRSVGAGLGRTVEGEAVLNMPTDAPGSYVLRVMAGQRTGALHLVLE